jgi:hypothetical protein
LQLPRRRCVSSRAWPILTCCRVQSPHSSLS